MLQKLILISIFYVFGAFAVSAQIEDIKIGKVISIKSEVLNEEREIFLYLPPNHNRKGNYPVIYMTDGEWSFHYASGIIEQLAENGKMPEAILVSIPNTDRSRDLSPTHTEIDSQGKPQPVFKTSGGGDNFLKFIETELSPHIEENYSSSKFRIFIGHSLGGLMSTHALLENSDFFNAFIAIDPSLWWDNRVMNKNLLEKLSRKRKQKNTYYMSSANNDNPLGNTMLEPQLEFLENLNSWDNDTLNIKREYFENDNHGSVGLLSVYNGLHFIFENYMVNFDMAVEDPEYMDNHFSKLSNRLGYTFSPSERAVNNLAYRYLLVKKDHNKALELFIQNTENHPNSANTYDSLSDAYIEMDNIEMAIQSLEKAIELDPNEQFYKQELNDLQAKNK